MKKRIVTTCCLLTVASLTLGGCATKKYTRNEAAASEARATERADRQINDLGTQVEANQGAIAENREGVSKASKTAQEALDRALEAGRLAEGKFLYETVLSNEDVRFEFDKADLGEEAATALDEFAALLKEQNENVFIEIQGHTDSTGEESYNLQLGEERAEAARRYLSKTGIALHRMSVISYGESEPVDDNKTRDGRARNRRVVLVVLQ